MTQDTAALYNAYASRDPRFDGVFYIGVTSTGIYCRPVCTARTPKAANCRFFGSAEAAEKASFRPCLRCRPERTA
jgi:AraC family transcriptional regulator of adaptative response / DNA-3-methyladenine glycosylase II